ncbi:MAG: DUF2490 domain-containing protein [Myxococcota bacterium]
MFWSALALAAPTPDAGVWSSVVTTAELDPSARAKLTVEAHFRRSGAAFVGLFRPSVGWAVTPGLQASLGYAWVPTWAEDTLGQEHRLWQQLVVSHKSDALQLAVRPRFEVRSVSGDSGIGLRGRLWGRVAVPFDEGRAIVLTEEPFWGFVATDATVAGFDQNRAFAGVALPLDAGRVEVGYLGVYVARDTGDTWVHALATNLFLGR